MSKKKTINDFIQNGSETHNKKYDYSLLNFINNVNEKQPIICHELDSNGFEHGIFYQSYSKHITRKHGCPKCAKNGVLYTNNQFKDKLKKLYGENIIISPDNSYINAHTKIKFICKKHGMFITKPYYLLQGHKCPLCGNEEVSNKLSLTCEDFIKKAKDIHGDKYDYSKVVYVNCETKVFIICPKHGDFFQTPHSHLNGSGCPICNSSHLERNVYDMLLKNNIKFNSQHKFKWLGKQRLDFYLPDYNIAIECQGEQHYIPTNFGSKKISKKQKFNYICKNDKKKYKLCKENGVTILFYTKKEFINETNKINTFSDDNLLLKIKEYAKN